MRLLVMRGRTVVASLAGLLSLVAGAMTQATAQTMRLELYPLQTVTLTGEQFLTGAKDGKPATVSGELRIPRLGTDRLPAVILVHGSGGVGANVDRWAQELTGIGVAAFVLDTFTGRGITNTVSDQSQLNSLAMMVDAYRALELLAKHPRIDPARIGLMGFSKGGVTALYASMKRFQRMHGPAGIEFAAYMPFYAPCYFRYIDDEDLSDKPIRLFHGVADDYVPIEPCRQYVERLQRAGKNVQLMEYPDAYHAFDAFTLKAPVHLPQAQTGRRCSWEERAAGQLVNRQTGQPFTLDDPCIERGATIAYNPQAHIEAIKTVKAFLVSTFKLSP
jgi:dienelactone hydrolase